MSDVRLNIDADGTGAERSLRDVANEAEDLADALDDVDTSAKDADRSLDDAADKADDLARRLRDVADDADDATRSTEDLGDELRDLDNAAPDNIGKRVGDDVDDGMRRASESTATFKDEARQNLSESVSSFRGDVEDIPQLIQDIFGGVAADLGPAGMVGGIFVAAGIGIGVAYLQGAAEKADELKQKTIDLARQMQEVEGDVSQLDLSTMFDDWGYAIADAREWWEIWQDAPITNIEQAADAARKLNLELSDLADGLSGVDPAQTEESLRDVEDRIVATDAAMANIIETEGLWGASQDDTWRALRDQRDELNGLRNNLEATSEMTEAAAEIEQQMTGAREDSVVAAEEAREQEDALRDTRDTMRETVAGLIESENGYYESLQNTTDAIKENGENWDASTEAGRENRSAILDLGDSMRDLTQSQIDNGASVGELSTLVGQQREEFIRQATAAGASREEADRLADSLGLIPEEVRVNFDMPTAAQTRRDINGRLPSDPQYVPVDFDLPSFGVLQSRVDAITGRIRAPLVRVRVGMQMEAV